MSVAIEFDDSKPLEDILESEYLPYVKLSDQFIESLKRNDVEQSENSSAFTNKMSADTKSLYSEYCGFGSQMYIFKETMRRMLPLGLVEDRRNECFKRSLWNRTEMISSCTVPLYRTIKWEIRKMVKNKRLAISFVIDANCPPKQRDKPAPTISYRLDIIAGLVDFPEKGNRFLLKTVTLSGSDFSQLEVSTLRDYFIEAMDLLWPINSEFNYNWRTELLNILFLLSDYQLYDQMEKVLFQLRKEFPVSFGKIFHLVPPRQLLDYLKDELSVRMRNNSEHILSFRKSYLIYVKKTGNCGKFFLTEHQVDKWTRQSYSIIYDSDLMLFIAYLSRNYQEIKIILAYKSYTNDSASLEHKLSTFLDGKFKVQLDFASACVKIFWLTSLYNRIDISDYNSFRLFLKEVTSHVRSLTEVNRSLMSSTAISVLLNVDNQQVLSNEAFSHLLYNPLDRKHSFPHVSSLFKHYCMPVAITKSPEIEEMSTVIYCAQEAKREKAKLEKGFCGMLTSLLLWVFCIVVSCGIGYLFFYLYLTVSDSVNLQPIKYNSDDNWIVLFYQISLKIIVSLLSFKKILLEKITLYLTWFENLITIGLTV